MAITESLGFDGPLFEIGWAKLATAMGNRGVVRGYNDWRVSPVAGERQISILPGAGAAAGVYVATDAPEVITLPTPSVAGTGRWYLVSAQRTWANNGFAFVLIPGPTDKANPTAYPAEVSFEPGGVYDQPLAWARVRADNTDISIIDLRETAPTPGITEGSHLIGTGGLAVYTTVFATGSMVDVAEVNIELAQPTKVRIEAIGQWVSTGNAAGSHTLRLNGVQLAPIVRAHNEGKAGIPMPLVVTATHTLPAGKHRILLSASAETAGSPRRVGLATINVWKG